MDFSFWKRLWTYHETDYRMNERLKEWMNENVFGAMVVNIKLAEQWKPQI